MGCSLSLLNSDKSTLRRLPIPDAKTHFLEKLKTLKKLIWKAIISAKSANFFSSGIRRVWSLQIFLKVVQKNVLSISRKFPEKEHAEKDPKRTNPKAISRKKALLKLKQALLIIVLHAKFESPVKELNLLTVAFKFQRNFFHNDYGTFSQHQTLL